MTPWLHLETPLLELTLSPVVNIDLFGQFALGECSRKARSGHLISCGLLYPDTFCYTGIEDHMT